MLDIRTCFSWTNEWKIKHIQAHWSDSLNRLSKSCQTLFQNDCLSLSNHFCSEALQNPPESKFQCPSIHGKLGDVKLFSDRWKETTFCMIRGSLLNGARGSFLELLWPIRRNIQRKRAIYWPVIIMWSNSQCAASGYFWKCWIVQGGLRNRLASKQPFERRICFEAASDQHEGDYLK